MAGSRWHPPSNPTGICLVPSTLNSCTASQIEAKFLSIFAEGYIFVKHCYQNKSLNSKEREWIFFEMKHLHKGTYCRAPLIFEMEADISTNFCCHFFFVRWRFYSFQAVLCFYGSPCIDDSCVNGDDKKKRPACCLVMTPNVSMSYSCSNDLCGLRYSISRIGNESGMRFVSI